MMKFNRPQPPRFLSQYYKQWGRQYAQLRAKNRSTTFRWKKYQGRSVNELLLESLDLPAQKHCAFCDGYPLGTFARQTIEHFRPKSLYPRLVYAWPNLFVCCDVCQGAKRETFDKQLLKPDVDDYSFYRYFLLNYSTGDIEVNPAATEADQQRAQITIDVYCLNKYGRPQSRIQEYKKYQIAKADYTLDDFPYRFFLE